MIAGVLDILGCISSNTTVGYSVFPDLAGLWARGEIEGQSQLAVHERLPLSFVVSLVASFVGIEESTTQSKKGKTDPQMTQIHTDGEHPHAEEQDRRGRVHWPVTHSF